MKTQLYIFMLGRGYMAPEYAVLGQLSVKLDVYSFGVLILEIVTGRKNTDMFESNSGETIVLLSYVSCSPTIILRFHIPRVTFFKKIKNASERQEHRILVHDLSK